MTEFKVLFIFYKVLNKFTKTEVDRENIIGSSVLDCSRKAFDYKRDLESRMGGEIVYKKTKIEKINKQEIDKEIEVDEKSDELSAEDALQFIKNHSVEFIENSGFIADSEDRVTVKRAYLNKKQKQKDQ